METLRSCEVYDYESNTWTACAPLQIARSGSRVVALDDRYLAAIGGCDDVFGRAETQPTVEIFDVELGKWTLLEGRLTYPRTTAAAAALDSRRLFVVGGAPSLSSAEVYRVQLPSSGTEASECGGGSGSSSSEEESSQGPAEEVAGMPDGRMGCQAAVLDLPGRGEQFPMTTRKSIVIIGGERCDAGSDWPRVRQFSNAPVFDFQTQTWRDDSPVPSMAAPRTAVALAVGVGHVSHLD